MADVTVLDDSGNPFSTSPKDLWTNLATADPARPVTVLDDEGKPFRTTAQQLRQSLMPAALLRPEAPEAQQPAGSALRRFVTGAAQTLNPLPMLKSLVSAPQGTAETAARAAAGPLGLVILKALQAQGQQFGAASDEAAKRNWVGAAGHALAGATPLIGPAAAQIGDQLGGTQPQFDKYGNVVKPGTAPDVASAAGGATGLLASLVAPMLSRAVAPAARNAFGLASSPEATYAKALNPAGRVDKLLTREDVVPGLLNRGVTGSLQGIQKLATQRANAAGSQIGAKLDAIDQSGAPYQQVRFEQRLPEWAADQPLAGDQPYIKVTPGAVKQSPALTADFAPTLKRLRAYRDAFTADGQVINEAGYNAADRVLDTLQDVVKNQAPGVKPNNVSLSSAFQARRILDDAVAGPNGRGYVLPDEQTANLLDARREAANGIRNVLNDDHPDIAALNKEYSFWSDVQQVVGNALDRQVGQQGSLNQLARFFGRMAGGAAGGFSGYHGGGLGGTLGGTAGGAYLGGEAAAVLDKAFRSPAWRTTSAVTRDGIAKALASRTAHARQPASTPRRPRHPAADRRR